MSLVVSDEILTALQDVFPADRATRYRDRVQLATI